MSATQTALKKAMQAANAAVALDQAGDTRGALTAYRGALNQMREVIAQTNKPNTRQVLEAKVNEYGLRLAQLEREVETLATQQRPVAMATKAAPQSPPAPQISKRKSVSKAPASVVEIEREYDSGDAFYVVLRGADDVGSLPALQALGARATALDSQGDHVRAALLYRHVAAALRRHAGALKPAQERMRSAMLKPANEYAARARELAVTDARPARVVVVRRDGRSESDTLWENILLVPFIAESLQV